MKKNFKEKNAANKIESYFICYIDFVKLEILYDSKVIEAVNKVLYFDFKQSVTEYLKFL